MTFNINQAEYVRLRQIIAEDLREVTFFVGAGISAEVGLPTWRALRDKLYRKQLKP